jgi:signal transduction histidine kinase
MSAKNFQSLRFKINVVITITSLIIVFVFGAIYSPYEYGRRMSRFEEIQILMSSIFEQKREEIANEIFARQISALNNSLNTVKNVKGVSKITVYGKDGFPLASTNHEIGPKLGNQEKISLKDKPLFQKKYIAGHPYAEYSSTIEVIGEHVGYIKMYYDLGQMEGETFHTLVVFILLLASTLVVMSLLLNILLSRFVLQPTSLLRNAITKLQKGDLGEQVTLASHDEIGEVAAAFNEMSLMMGEQHKALMESLHTRDMYAQELEYTNKSLEILNARLEEIVEERTADLTKSNALLQQEINERRRADEVRKELEERLARSQKMEALGILAGGVAHDLNNVLSGIVSYPDLLLMEMSENNPMKKPITSIRDSGQKAAAIVQDLLTLARRGVIQSTVLDMNEDIILDYLHSPEHENLLSLHPGIRIETALDRKLLKVKGSPVHIKKSLMNLVINAMEAQPGGGIIRISTSNIYVDRPIEGYDTVFEGDYVILRIEDEGIGIDKEDIKRIFEPFYTKKVMGRSGTGIGMAVVWGTVQDHNGYINIYSAPGKGTAFEIYFPVTREETVPEKGIIPLEEYLGHGERILIVDDIEEQRALGQNILEKLNYSVAAVGSGEEAVAYIQEHPVDLLLLDMIMDPGIDGLDTYKRIIEIRPGQKAIISSGFAENERVNEAQELGVSAYIRKPYTIEKLGISLKSVLSS